MRLPQDKNGKNKLIYQLNNNMLKTSKPQNLKTSKPQNLKTSKPFLSKADQFLNECKQLRWKHGRQCPYFSIQELQVLVHK